MEMEVRSVQSSPGRSRSEERRRKVYEACLRLRRDEETGKWSKLTLKLKEDRKKIEKVHRNLHMLSLQKRSKTKQAFESVAKNKLDVSRTIAEDIEKKKVVIDIFM